ncbi:MAG TPA: lipid carrier--UDP-N-acetylgalactosaminyltransferase [Erysipelotrichaceae bacterium]|nr:lipid carrier--UDP-N-acetylgalactosaminyltransferase [Erysipelotrichaceae bacterium]
MRLYLTIKRTFDFVLSLFAIFLLSPFFLVFTLLIKLSSRGPVLFKQERIGRNKVHFDILKFRTMRIETPKNTPTHLLDNPEQWITPIGKFLRKYSLDELPQLFNILKGDMSIVGPRPALWNQFDLIELRDQYGVNCILPGLTGWAQVNGRDELSIELKVNYDIEYLERMSLLFDITCVYHTFFKVLRSEGVVEGKSK